MLIDATMQSKNPQKKHKERPQTEHQQRHQKGPNGAPGKMPKNTFGRQPVHGKVGQFRLSLAPCALCKNKHNQRLPQTEHQRDKRFSQNGAPASPIREHKWSTRKHNQRPQKEHQKISKKTVFSRDFHLQLILIGQLTQLSQNYFALQSLHKALPSTTLYYKACTKHFPVLRCTTKLAQSTSQYYFVLQSLHKALPITTLYYKACTSYFPVLLCTTKLAKSISPVLLCTTKLAKSISQYYFVLQSCTKYFPVLLCSAKLAQSTFHYYFALTTHAYVDGTMELPQA